MYLVFDLETTGLPKKRKASHKVTWVYDSSRIVSVAWQLLNKDCKPIQKGYCIIKPESFIIPEESTQIHGITHNFAFNNGVPFETFVDIFKPCIENAAVIISHNIEFDARILLSELHRRGFEDVIEHILGSKLFCTMEAGKTAMKTPRFPKLLTLYEHLCGSSIDESKLHNSYWDTELCKDCFIKLKELGKHNFMGL